MIEFRFAQRNHRWKRRNAFCDQGWRCGGNHGPATVHARGLVLADEVLANCRATDHTLALVRNLFSAREVVELLLLIGYFRMICVIMTTLEVEVESPFRGKVLDSLRDSARGQPGQCTEQESKRTMFQPPRIEQFGLSRANERDLGTLLARMETEAVARQAPSRTPSACSMDANA